MLKKLFRLTGKDINYILKKKKVIPTKYFTFFLIPQYPNRQFNQFSAQIPLKLSKKAVVRNYLKRIMYNYIDQQDLIKTRFNGNFYKVFIVTNKKMIPDLQKTIETTEKNFIKLEVEKILDNSFYQLSNSLGKKKKIGSRK